MSSLLRASNFVLGARYSFVNLKSEREEPIKLLLTGAGGFVGSHTLRHILSNTDWEVYALDSFRHKGKTDRIRVQTETNPEWQERVHVIPHDLTVPISTQLKTKLGDIDYVINMASESHVDRSISDPRDFIENNVALVLTMLEWLRETPSVQQFIHISTDEVYGPALDHDHKEGEPHRPSNPYSASKSAQEQICYAYWRTYDLPIVITNTMNIIGELQDPEKFIPKTIKAVDAGEAVIVHVSPEGHPGSRYYLHARNQADALLYILTHHTPSRYPAEDIDRFNVVGERELDNLVMAQMIAEFVGKPAKIEPVDFHSSRPGHDLRYALNGEKMKAIGWTPPYPLEATLKRTVEWTLNHREWLND
jgi:dTDP-glucose 4,6-dehydratase